MVSPPSRAVPAFVRLAGHELRWQLLTELARSDLRVRELVALVGQPQNLVSYHLRLLREGGLVTAVRSSFDGRDSYYHLDLSRCADGLSSAGASLHPALGLTPPSGDRRSSVLFVCTGNSARSPIAEALLGVHAAGRAVVTSAGSAPRPALHPAAVRVLRDRYGVDVAEQRPRHLDTLAGQRFDYVVTLCDRVREICPEFGGESRRVHWSVADPSGGDDAVFARTAADIDTRVRYLLPVLARPVPTG
ncbi:ArsR family transcriptional regulator [Cryptosporangium aurantiacum]|uniref:Protein-tyrosine-phosphatase n=1 Tax=Cryptosporangium aurantiacum TaxID=134849 RepID=A0A1M7RPP5_9ACTN|nr:ArsR family transcriptional regulator [Cryptosporangium aurantiacum]SHN48066.1 Protein-tyrosine-phosphatase [Cryptosporangium aurantiacum]